MFTNWEVVNSLQVRLHTHAPPSGRARLNCPSESLQVLNYILFLQEKVSGWYPLATMLEHCFRTPFKTTKMKMRRQLLTVHSTLSFNIIKTSH